jgi:hypothetical protein
MPIPECFCWTRFGPEAGQSVEQILARKEQERVANGGVFFWGIGNALGPSMVELLRRTESPEVIFSPIRTAPRPQDASPSSVVAWTAAETLSGDRYQLPRQCLITSRFDPENPRSRHYALVCRRTSSVKQESERERIEFSQLKNLLTGRAVGASQVTAVVRVDTNARTATVNSYEVAFRAELAAPYFIVLQAPVPLPVLRRDEEWADIVQRAWNSKHSQGHTPDLFDTP